MKPWSKIPSVEWKLSTLRVSKVAMAQSRPQPVSEANLFAEQAGFEVRDVENLREHYALKLRHWVARLEANRDAAVRLVGDPVYRTWRLYMASSAVGFESGVINVNQTLLAKPAPGAAKVPLTRADLYANP